MSELSANEKARIYYERMSAEKLSGSHKYLHGPFITISRQTGAGANFVCDRLMEFFYQHYAESECPWVVFDKNLIDKVIEGHQLPEKLREYLNEEKRSVIGTMMNELVGLHPPMVQLIHKTNETILQLANMGNCIIVGRAANLVTAAHPHAIHVRLIAPHEHRVQHMRDSYNMLLQEAVDFIKKEDEGRKQYVVSNFNKNPDDPRYYHLLINTGFISFEEAAVMIGNYALTKAKQLKQPVLAV